MDQNDRLVIVLILVGVIVFWGLLRTTGMTSYELGSAAGLFIRQNFLYIAVIAAVLLAAWAVLRRR